MEPTANPNTPKNAKRIQRGPQSSNKKTRTRVNELVAQGYTQWLWTRKNKEGKTVTVKAKVATDESARKDKRHLFEYKKQFYSVSSFLKEICNTALRGVVANHISTNGTRSEPKYCAYELIFQIHLIFSSRLISKSLCRFLPLLVPRPPNDERQSVLR